MQQVGARAAAASIVIQPKRPVVRHRRRAVRGFSDINRAWVLHKPLIIKLMAGMLVAMVLASAFHARGGITQAAIGLSNILQGEFAEAGLGVSEISISGQVLTSERRVLEALALDERVSILGVDVADVRERLLELPAVSDATVRKIYPDQLEVSLTERHPVARWTSDGVTFLVDASGAEIGLAEPYDKRLPLVIGDGAADNALIIIRAMGRYPAIKEGLVAYSRLADRRWDLIYDTGLRVQLPETGVAQALEQLNAYQAEYQLLDREVQLIDMRVEGVLAVRPTAEPVEEEAAS